MESLITTATYWFIIFIIIFITLYYEIAILLLNNVYFTKKKSPIGRLELCPCVMHLIHRLNLSITVPYIIVYVTTHPYCAGCTAGLLLYTDRLVITLQTNWIRYSHTNHGKLYLGKERKRRNNNLYETTKQEHRSLWLMHSAFLLQIGRSCAMLIIYKAALPAHIPIL